MTVEQKADPFRPVKVSLFDIGRICIACDEYIRSGELVVLALHPYRPNPIAHYLCAVQYEDSFVSRNSRDHEGRV